VNGEVLASDLGISRRHIEHLVHEGLPRIARGQFPRLAALRWYIHYLQAAVARRGPNTTSASDEIAQEKLLTARIEREGQELELRKRKSELLERAVVQPQITAAGRAAVSILDAIPDRCASLARAAKDDHESHSIIQAEIQRAKEAYCRALAKI
jgi:phage terminase Nu1 subunit (DNA packaging protein)